MILRKSILCVIFFLISISCFAQVKPILFGGVDYYRNKAFTADAFINVHIGAQLFQWHFLAPEVGFEHHFGSLDDVNQLHPENPNARAPTKLKTRFSTSTFSMAPKFIFGNEEAALVFLPQYNLGRITARGDLLIDAGDDYLLEDQDKISRSISFWSFAVGVEGQFYESEMLHFALLLEYHTLNSEATLGKINFEESDLVSIGGSRDGLGIGFRVYLDFLQLLKEK